MQGRVSGIQLARVMDGGNLLYALSMHTGSIQLYRFDSGKNTLKLVKNYMDSAQLGLTRPENLCLSPDEKWLAVVCMPTGKVQIYAFDQEKMVKPIPAATFKADRVNGAHFAPDGKTLAWVQLDPRAKICFARIIEEADGSISIKKFQTIKNPVKGLVPKSLDFSKDGQFVVVAGVYN